MARALSLSRGQDLTDLGCGRGGPGLWLARELDVGLTGVDFSPVRVAARAIWHEAYTRVFRTALELGDHGDDTALAELQDEAREQLPTADLVRRAVITATRPGRSVA